MSAKERAMRESSAERFPRVKQNLGELPGLAPVTAISRQHAADGSPTGAAATLRAEADELLNALSRIDLGRVEVAAGIETDLVQPMELAGFASAASDSAELLQRVALEDVDRHVGVVADVEARLRRVGREIHRHRGSRQAVGLHRDELFLHEAALAGGAARIRAWLAEVGIAAVEDLHAIVAAVADVNQAV